MALRFLSPSGMALVVTLMLHGTASQAEVEHTSLADMSLEELSNIEVTSVSKRAERWSDAPTSVYVITSDDIRRSGARSLPEALRLAPNLHVAQTVVGAYSISARGFNSQSANKLLVLIDGRSVYTPLFSGVFWDVQDVMLEDIERIEVISGPGGTAWGVNAVNGVINVITRTAQDTQGGLAVVGAGNREADVSARYGGSWETGGYRLYAKQFNRQHSRTAAGTDIDDAWRMAQAGFRADWWLGEDVLSMQGNAYRGDRQQPKPGAVPLPGVPFVLGSIPVSGTNLIGRWEHPLDGGSTLSLQASYDQTVRDIRFIFAEALDIADVQFQHSLAPMAGHLLVWGGEYRYSADRVINETPKFGFSPSHVRQQWSSLFLQDEVTLSKNLRLTLGARAERNDYTGTEFLPTARLAWKLAPNHLLWSAASRTVRAPSRLDRDVFAVVPLVPHVLLPQPGGGPDREFDQIRLIGGRGFQSEIAKVYELGYRGQPTVDTSLSATLFHARYDHLRSQESDLSAPPVSAIYFGNALRAATTGLEMWGTYQVSSIWRLRGGYTNLHESFGLRADSNDSNGLATATGRDPRQTWVLSSSHDLPGQTELDITMRHVSALSSPVVPSYLAIDFRYSWRPQRNLEISVTGQNLLGTQHGEFTDMATRAEIGPNVFFNVVSHF